jgi:diaminopimelate epimerase
LRKIPFYKYHGTGNDFIMVDNRAHQLLLRDPHQVAALCHRRFGIGADGLILLEESARFDFKMKYFNADGKEGSMCGNGGRCIAAFASFLGIIKSKTTFDAIDGSHEAVVLEAVEKVHTVGLKMNNVIAVNRDNGAYVMDTGSPHYVKFCQDVETMDIVSEGKKIRYNATYKSPGINVNFVSGDGEIFSIRTYERGVEDETYSCGTGTVAAAIAVDAAGKSKAGQPVKFETRGGLLEVSFQKNESIYSDIWLTGPATQVFEGTFQLV